MLKPLGRTPNTPNDAALVSRRNFLQSGTGLFALACVPSDILANQFPEPLKLVTRTSRALGTTVSVKALHPATKIAEQALNKAFKELYHIESILSIYRRNSQVSQLNRTGDLKNPDPILTDILKQSIAWSERSQGAFDITVQPLWALFQSCKKMDTLPKENQIKATQSKVNWKQINLSLCEVQLKGQGTAITLNGIAQGFATDFLRKSLKDEGIEHALIDCGEIGTIGTNPKGKAWTAGIQHPRRSDAFSAVTEIDDRCLSTSGDYATTFSKDYRSNHLFDPSTGQSPQELSSVTILAPNATDADALSTAVFIMGPDKGMKLIRQCPSTDAYMVLKDGTTLVTEGFPCLL